jgi:hypothetical protein
MLIAIAFLCLSSADDCEREAVVRAVVGGGATPSGCLMDGAAGAAANVALAPDEGYRLVIACRRSDSVAATLAKPSLACADRAC